MNLLEKVVDETNEDNGTKKFTVFRHLNTMMYANLVQKDSLRDIVTGIIADQKLLNILAQ